MRKPNYDSESWVLKLGTRSLQFFLAAGVTACVILAVVTLPYFMTFHGRLSSQHEHWGQFGDYFGGILNPIFALLAFLGLAVTVWLQIQAIRFSIDQLAESVDANKAQGESTRRQNFESSFFQLLGLHNDIVNAMSIASTAAGRTCFDALANGFRTDIERHPTHPNADVTMTLYETFSLKYQDELGHYFRLLYNILKFVDRADGIEDKKFYTNLVRAQLSNPELVLLFYNCLSHWGVKKFKPMVEKFAILKTITTSGLDPDLIRRYSRDAFSGAYPDESD